MTIYRIFPVLVLTYKAGGDRHYTEEMLEAAYNRLSEEDK